MKKAKKKPSAAKLALSQKTKLRKRGVSVDRAGHARKRGKLLSAAQVRRAVAAIKRAVPAPKKTTKRSAPKPTKKKIVRTGSTVSAGSRKAPAKKVAPPSKKPSRGRAITKRPVAVTKKPARKVAPLPKKPTLTRAARARAEERRLAREAAERKERRLAKQRADARRERALERQREVAAQLKAQEKRSRALEREQRKARKEIEQLRESLAKLQAAPPPAPPTPPAPPKVEAAPPRAPAPPTAAAPPPPAPPRAMTDIERLEAELAEEEAARAATRPPAAATPFEIMLNDAIARGVKLTPEEVRQMQIAAAAFAEGAGVEATDADYVLANAYANLTQPEQLTWARARDAQGQPRLTEAAKRIIREHAIEKAIEHRNIKTLIDMRKSPVFQDDLQIRQMMRTLGALDGRKSMPFQEARDLILDYLRSKDKYAQYRDEINAFLTSIRPTSEQIQEAIKYAKTDIERQRILEELIPELAKRHPQLDIRELWAMAKSPQYVAVVV